MSWIKIEDQEPEHDQKVIVFSEHSINIAMATFYKREKTIQWHGCGFVGADWDWEFLEYRQKYKGITHWMPIPLLPDVKP